MGFCQLCVCTCSVTQSCPLCNPTDCSLGGSSVGGVFQARILEWAAVSFPRGSSRPGTKFMSLALAAAFVTTAPSGAIASFLLLFFFFFFIFNILIDLLLSFSPIQFYIESAIITEQKIFVLLLLKLFSMYILHTWKTIKKTFLKTNRISLSFLLNCRTKTGYRRPYNRYQNKD